MKKRFHPILLIAVLWAALTLFSWFKPATEISDSERRKLDQFPEFSWSSVMNGGFMKRFESAATDQFPLRESFRRLRATFSTYVFGQLDNHDIIRYKGYLEKLSAPASESSLQKFTGKVTDLYETWFPDSDVYFAVVPEKGYYIPDSAGYPLTDYAAILKTELPFAQTIDLTGTLSLESYYHTDSHWRQEHLADTAQLIAEAMGVSLSGSYQEEVLKTDFRGVYAGQSALPVADETIVCLRNDILDSCVVYNYETQKTTGLYDPDCLSNRDPYDVFLGGAVSVLTIENPKATTDRELIVFRDSFGSSLIPLLSEAYAKVTVLDTRYIAPSLLGQFVDFHGQDVLMLYSTGVLNSSDVLR